jgi:hypothetical protein
MSMKLLGVISGGSVVMDLLPIRFYAFGSFYRKNGNKMGECISYLYDSDKREVLYIILVEFDIPKKLMRLIKMCLNETYSKVHVGK